MAENAKTTTVPKKRAPTLYFIIACKMVKGDCAMTLALAFLAGGHDLPDVFDKLLRWVHIDPETEFFQDIGDKLDKITPANVRWVAIGTFLYSLFLLVEGIGLMFRATWAGLAGDWRIGLFHPDRSFELMRHRG